MLNTSEQNKKFAREKRETWDDGQFESIYNSELETVMKKTPARYKNADIKDIPESVQACFPPSKSGKYGIYLWGAVGTGKTHILYALRKYWAQQMVAVDVHNVSEELNEIKQSFSSNKEQRDILDAIEQVVFLDDLGVEKDSDWAGEQIYRLVNEIYENPRPYVFTSNFSLQQLAERFGAHGDRIASRIAQSAHIVELKGNDRRI